MNQLLKKTSFLLFMLLLVQSIQAQGWGSGVKGSGPVVEQELDIAPFTGINFNISGNVILRPGNRQEVVVKAQKNIINLIKTDVKNGIWRIDVQKNVKSYNELTIYITVPEIDYVELGGSGNISCNGQFPKVDRLRVDISGSGNIDMDIKANHLKTHLSGSGNINMTGSCNYQDIHISGSGNISNYKFQAQESDVHVSGSGRCELYVTDQLNAKISGSGDVYYKGRASVKAKVSGSGNVTPAD